MKTEFVKKEKIKRETFLVDAQGRILGRMAARIAHILQGKHKPTYTPNVDTGDRIIVINADKLAVSGKKLKQKMYKRYSGYPGGLKETPLEKMLVKKSDEVVRLAVKRMLPKNRLASQMLKKLRVYTGESHPHQAQNPKELKL